MFPIHYVHVGSNEHGDRYALDRADPSLSADCPVVLLSHETGAEERRWGSVAEFLEDVLTA